MNKGLKHIRITYPGWYWFGKRNTDLMNKGLKRDSPSNLPGSVMIPKETLTWWIRDWNFWILVHIHFIQKRKKRNTDLMNKGLKLFVIFLTSENSHFKRNTDLMNKGLKLSLHIRQYCEDDLKETLTWWIRDWNNSDFHSYSHLKTFEKKHWPDE